MWRYLWKKLSDNKYGFCVNENNPFFIFPYLQQLSKENYKWKILDLSRWDPGLWFSPAEKSRKFYWFLIILDSYLNSNITHFRIHEESEKNIEELIKKATFENFTKEVWEKHLETLDFIIKKISEFALFEWEKWSRIYILNTLFKYSALAWWTYHSPWGKEIVKLTVANLYRKFLKDDSIQSEDLIFTLWVNDWIWTLFKILWEQSWWLWFLKKWDLVACSMPAYFPYFNEINKREYKTADISMNVETWELDFSKLENSKERIKVFFLISPNNPSGHKYSKKDIQKIAELAEKNDALIITDEIYAEFYDDFDSIWNFAKKRTIRLSWRSKIQRSPWIRFWDVLIWKETNEYLTNHLFWWNLWWNDFKTIFTHWKWPWWNYWSFQHTASVPWPSQILGMLHILLWENEQENYKKVVQENTDNFFKVLWINSHWKNYYWIFDLNNVFWSNKKSFWINEKLYDLAVDYWIILIPAMKFFSEEDLAKKDRSNFVRVSLPNLNPKEIVEAWERIKEYLAK